MKILLSLLIVLSLSANDQISIATLEWSPFSGKSLVNYGQSLHKISQVFKGMNINVEYKFLPWARALKSSEEGTYQALAPLYFDIKRLDHFYYSEEIQKTPLVLVTRSNSPIKKYEKVSLLKKYKFGVVRGYKNIAEVDSDLEVDKEYSIDDLTNLKKLDSSRVDLIVVDLNVFERLKKLHNFKSKFKVLTPHLDEKSLYIAFPIKSKNSKTLRDKFNEGLKKLNQ